MKTATVNVRINEEIKLKAEKILEEIGLPRATAIDLFYRQIIINNGIPFSLKRTPKVIARDSLTDEEFNNMMDVGYQQALRGEGDSLEEAIEDLKAVL